MEPSLLALTEALRRHAAAAHARRILVLTGSAGACHAAAARIAASPGAGETAWIADGPAQALPWARAPALLGQERDTLILDLFSGWRADALGAAGGALRAGGLLVLLGPPLSDWARHGALLGRLARLLPGAPGVLVAPAEGPLPALPPAPPSHTPETLAGPCRTADQARAVAAIERLLTGRPRRPVVLFADRGRGKSAALGIAVGQHLQRTAAEVILTGPSQAAVAAALGHAARILAVPVRGGGVQASGGGRLRFLPPGELWARAPAADLVLVDEAATLPVPLLTGLLDRHPRIGFATTLHGYEGTGHGFALRFAPVLDARTPGWRRILLRAPVRYAQDDPLEALLGRALALDATLPPPPAPGPIRVAPLDPAALAADDPTLGALMGLLIHAHYRTSPADLQRLLEDPAHRCFGLWRGPALAGAAVSCAEGGLDPTPLAAGPRRPQGHLLPETLRGPLGLADAPGLRYARIVRLAIHPALQRGGLGSQLCAALAAQLTAEGIDCLGTAFGAEAPLLRFWSRAGLLPVRLGVRPGKSTGLRAAIALRPLSAGGAALAAQARARFADELPHALTDALRDLDTAQVWALVSLSGPPAALDPADAAAARACAAGQRGLDHATAALWRFSWHALRAGRGDALPPAQRDVLLRKILQRWPWEAVAREAGLPSRDAAEASLRAALRILDPQGVGGNWVRRERTAARRAQGAERKLPESQ